MELALAWDWLVLISLSREHIFLPFRKGLLAGLVSPLDSPLSVYTIQRYPCFVNTFYEIFLKIFFVVRKGRRDPSALLD